MASRNVNVEDTWTVEPELTETPPRRVVHSDYPDKNQPPAPIYYGAAGIAAVVGLFLLILGLTGNPMNGILVFLGVILLLAGVGVAIAVPQLIARYNTRAERLAMHGLPVMARIVSSDNLAGDNASARLVRYQVVLPGGDLVHKQVHVDDRLLPRRIPGNATALVDIDTNDVELYCALPFRVISKSGPAARPATQAVPDPLADMPVAKNPTVAAPTGMNTLSVEGIQPVRVPKHETGVKTDPHPAPAAATTAAAHAGSAHHAPQETYDEAGDLESVLGADMAKPKTAEAPATIGGLAPMPSVGNSDAAPATDAEPAGEATEEKPEGRTRSTRRGKKPTSGLPWE